MNDTIRSDDYINVVIDGFQKPRPTKVKIGYRDYAVKDWHPHDASGRRAFGETNDIGQYIQIDFTTCSPVQAAETLLHEIMHAICSVWHHDDKKDDEERTVSVLASGLATVWRDNPEVMAWIDEQLCGGKA